MNNQIFIVGHVGQEPYSREFPTSKVVKFSVGVKEYDPNSDEKKTLWLDVDAWNGLGDRVLEIVTKGREIALTGRLAINHYEKEVDGTMVQMSKPVIKLTGFHLCGAKPNKTSQPVAEVKTTKRKKLAAVPA